MRDQWARDEQLRGGGTRRGNWGKEGRVGCSVWFGAVFSLRCGPCVQAPNGLSRHMGPARSR